MTDIRKVVDMLKTSIVGLGCVALALLGGVAFADSKTPQPLWELPLEKRGTLLSRANAFDIPQSAAIPDHTSFTVEVDLKINELPTLPRQAVPILDEDISRTGFSLGLRHYHPGNTADSTVFGLFLRLNGKDGYEVRCWQVKRGGMMRFRVKFRNGFAVVSQRGQGPNDWAVLNSFLTILSPNERPIRVGESSACPSEPNTPDVPGVTLEGLRFYGADYEPFAANEDRRPANGVLAGDGFAMTVPVAEPVEKPRFLYVGDSISFGYMPLMKKRMGEKAYLYHWGYFWGGAKPAVLKPEHLKGPLTYRAYDVVVFNNGLHSLNWNEATATDGEIRAHYESLADAFRANCPKARLIYLTSTPVGRCKDAQGKYVPPSGNGSRNDVVLRLNRIATQVMREKGIEVLDAYALMSKHLGLLTDDCHYSEEGCQILANLIADCIEK